MDYPISRRRLLKSGLVTGALVPVLGLVGPAIGAPALTPLDVNDPTAKALGFVPDASKVVASANPTYKAGQMCGTCAQFQGQPTDARAGCNIFVGHTVPKAGWCRVWVQKPAAKA